MKQWLLASAILGGMWSAITSMNVSNSLLFKKTTYFHILPADIRTYLLEQWFSIPYDNTLEHCSTALRKLVIQKQENELAVLLFLLHTPALLPAFNSTDSFGFTPLISAVQDGSHRCLNLLVASSYVNVNCYDFFQFTPVIWSILHRQIPCLQRLLRIPGIDVNKADMFKNTALHYAARNNDLEALELLLKAHANPTLKNGQRLTPKKMAKNKEARRLIKRFTPGKSFPISPLNIPLPIHIKKIGS